MRDFQNNGRSAVYADRGMVAASHPEAVRAALDVLRTGGNAVDAAVAASFVLAVAEPHMTGLGGDCFALYAPFGGAVLGINGSGRAPLAATLDRLRERGVEAIDSHSAHAVTVPGAVDAWCRLAEDHGTRPLDELVAPAIALAERGTMIQPRVAADWATERGTLAHDEGARRVFLRAGLPPAPGDRHTQPLLAATLRQISRHGRDGFYLGPVAEDIVTHLERRGGLHTLEDLAAQRSTYVDPVCTDYRGYTVQECPPNGQGLAALMILNILSGFERGLDQAGRAHILAEATELVYRDRDALLGDPAHGSVSIDELLSQRHAARLRASIQCEHAARQPAGWSEREHRDTVYLCVVDRDRNAVSIISSLFDAFGSGILAPNSGVLLHNRGAAFRLTANHPNAIAPGKRPLHTIIPGMLTKDGHATMVFGVTGGNYQPIGHAHILTQVLDRGMDVQQAIEEPRSFLDGTTLKLETRHAASTFDACRSRGHQTEWSTRPIGCAQAIWIDHDRGVLVGGSDPRCDGLASGF